MTSKDLRVKKGKEVAFEEKEVPLRDQFHIFQQKINVLIDNLMQRTFDLEASDFSRSGCGTEDVILKKTLDDSSKSTGWEQQKSPECYEGWGSLDESNQLASSNG
ncbi:Uncharacterized protein TCM_019187 [Theobroma cacao]|uniref:Uncharacterized protein n=1 Tax=Theobroma cacao TaxID=3641 RepID=A0A061EH20_THECC|nr:Uncharacterized protein TCM_019187 [Theobroma cacao]